MALPPHEFPKLYKPDLSHLYPSVGFDAPQQVRAAPRGQAMAFGGVPEKTKLVAHAAIIRTRSRSEKILNHEGHEGSPRKSCPNFEKFVLRETQFQRFLRSFVLLCVLCGKWFLGMPADNPEPRRTRRFTKETRPKLREIRATGDSVPEIYAFLRVTLCPLW